MAIRPEMQTASIGDLYFDPTNPRLGRRNASRRTSQEKVLRLMADFTLEELAISFLESKQFWPQEALIVVKETLYKQERLVVVEGNRRLAALKYLNAAIKGDTASSKWRALAESAELPGGFFDNIPYILADSRDDVSAFLGFRHVTGIKQWDPAEKAEYISKLIDDKHMTYEQVMRTIGSKTEPVRRNYIAFKMLMQLESIEDEDKVSLDHVEEKFSVLFLSLREKGVQQFLGVNIYAEPKEARTPVPQNKLDSFADFALWLFGTEKKSPLFTDSRNVGRFAKILESKDAVKYLRTSSEPSFELAVQKSGADEVELVDRLRRATDEIELSLGQVHLYRDSEEVQKAILRLGLGAAELLGKFPAIQQEVMGG